MKRRMIAMGLAVVTVVACVIGVTQTAFGDSGDRIDELVALNPGSTRVEMEAAVDAYVSASGASRDEVIEQAIAEGRQSVAAAQQARVVDRSVRGSEATVALGKGRSKGDIFISPSKTLVYEHGHTGIYFDTSTIVEAPGPGELSRSTSALTRQIARGTVKAITLVSNAEAASAGKYAYDSLRGKPYNYIFAFNRDADGSSMNCSQLVWAAYIKTVGIDLDSDGGPGVYPYDIKNSYWLGLYETL